MVVPVPVAYPAAVLTDPFDRILGTSAAADAVRHFGRRAATVDAPVLLLGESGTGKGILARAIHEASPRRRGAFVSVNCAAIPDALFESEFFGHVRGAFTGAQYAHKGLFEQADGGTLFLDEVGEIPLVGQAKLLTTLEDRQVRRIGAERIAAVNVRIVAATARDLHASITQGRFRGDLYHRLSVLSFRLPPLRERGDDVVELALTFLQLHSARYQRGFCVFDRATMDHLASYSWPGNIRELSNAIECALVGSTGDVVSLNRELMRPHLYASAAQAAQFTADATVDERTRIEEALRLAGGNKTHAARALGMARTTLWQKLKQFETPPNDPEQC